ncbi:unnamed protein product [Ceutorhynchus assimilis]|uniref:Uncharacterized protein n=1 Tax=Ceutorhynchus assimilis TaxID=467358 RepID=A0A9N9MVT2_9CUCU|nr:unnamed protein product [Ceutorhynchus assimilis]
MFFPEQVYSTQCLNKKEFYIKELYAEVETGKVPENPHIHFLLLI